MDIISKLEHIPVMVELLHKQIITFQEATPGDYPFTKNYYNNMVEEIIDILGPFYNDKKPNFIQVIQKFLYIRGLIKGVKRHRDHERGLVNEHLDSANFDPESCAFTVTNHVDQIQMWNKILGPFV